MARSLPQQQFQDANFSITRLRPSYVMDEVDKFRHNVVQQLSAGLPAMPPRHIPRFTRTRLLRRGYDKEEVDTFLQLLH